MGNTAVHLLDKQLAAVQLIELECRDVPAVAVRMFMLRHATRGDIALPSKHMSVALFKLRQKVYMAAGNPGLSDKG